MPAAAQQQMDMPFPPGRPLRKPGPLGRFLPPLEEGAVAQALRDFGEPGEFMVDPFGASPRLAVEAARAGISLLVACNNPVTRFVLEGSARPIPPADLKAALARIATAPKDNSRLEPYLLDLYLTLCSRCKASVPADRFIWDRDAQIPVVRTYSCPHCGHGGDESTTAADRERALSFARRGLHHAMALEQLAPAGDPDREHAEAALAVYTGRAVFALTTLTNRVSSLELEPTLRRAAQALMLSAFDTSNALWGYPEGRTRPRQLIASPHYLEVNAWKALEAAVDEWCGQGAEVPLAIWPEGGRPVPGSLAVFPGPSRELANVLRGQGVRWLLTVLPRPNQAFWTLSAMWAAWLWGREVAAPISVALHRRRYDWAWHASALRTAVGGLVPGLAAEAQLLALMPEAEPGFLAAAAMGLDAAGFELTGQALRAVEGQGVMRWSRRESGPLETVRNLRPRMQASAQALAQIRGEPTLYALLHAAAWGDLAKERLLGTLLQAEESRAMTLLNEELEAALADKKTFVHFGAGAEAEVGQYWLSDPATAGIPIADRVEIEVVRLLREEGPLPEAEIEIRACRSLMGLQTPERRLLQACLQSYGREEAEAGPWSLRAEDEAARRAQDRVEVAEILRTVGLRLGYQVVEDEALRWRDAFGIDQQVFRIREHALFGEALRDAQDIIYVIPGGRGALVAEKARRDPRLRAWLQQGLRVIKYRLVRRLADEATLTRENLAERLALDPMHDSDPQLPLL